jgi:ABC-2 type transport system permease protein
MKAFMLHLRFELLAGLRNRVLLLMNYLLPLGFYALIGGMMVQINPGFGEQLIPAMVVFALLSGVIMGLPTPLVEARAAGILRCYRVNGVPAFSLLAIPAIASAVHMILVAAAITLSAPLLFGAPLPVHWPAFLLVVGLIFFAHSGLGVLIGVISPHNRLAILWQQLIYLPSILLGGLMVPLAMLPDHLRKLGHLFPATYGMQAFQSLAYGRETLYHPYLVLAALVAGGLAAFGLAFYLFSWDERRRARRAGPTLAAFALAPYLVGALLLA